MDGKFQMNEENDGVLSTHGVFEDRDRSAMWDSQDLSERCNDLRRSSKSLLDRGDCVGSG